MCFKEICFASLPDNIYNIYIILLVFVHPGSNQLKHFGIIYRYFGNGHSGIRHLGMIHVFV